MGRYIADQNKVTMLYESGTYANASGAGQWLGMVTDHGPTDTVNVEQIKYAGTADRSVSFQQTTSKDFEGAMTKHPQDWRMLGFALGSVVDTSGATSTHIMKERNNDTSWPYSSGAHNPFPHFAIEDAKVAPGTGKNFIRNYQGCTVDSYSLTGEQGGILQEEVSYIAKEGIPSSGTPTAVTENTLRPFLWRDINWAIEGTTYSQLRDFTFDVTNTIERNRYPNGSDVIEAVAVTNRTYNYDVSMDANSENTRQIYEQYYLGGSSFNQTLTIEATPTRSLTITMSGCRITEMDDPTAVEGVAEVGITITPSNVSAAGSDAIAKYNPW